MERNIKNIRIEDLIQSEFDKESQYRGTSTPDRNSENAKAILAEEIDIFCWLMPIIHEGRLNTATFWFRDDGLDLENRWEKVINHYTSKRDCVVRMALDSLIRKMRATEKVELVEKTGSFITIEFNF